MTRSSTSTTRARLRRGSRVCSCRPTGCPTRRSTPASGLVQGGVQAVPRAAAQTPTRATGTPRKERRRRSIEIEHRALLTGNPEPVARARMEIIGLNHLFPPGQGAFGCDAEDRAHADRPRPATGRRLARASDTVAVGDTPADITGARAAGVHDHRLRARGTTGRARDGRRRDREDGRPSRPRSRGLSAGS